MNPRDTDPLHYELPPPDPDLIGTEYKGLTQRDLDGRHRGPTPGYRLLYVVGKLLGVLLMALILFGFGVILGAGFSVGANLVQAAESRSSVVPVGGALSASGSLSNQQDRRTTGAPHERAVSGPRLVPVPPAMTAAPQLIGRHGTLSHMGRGYPADYLAIPLGPGVTVKLCGVRCGIYVSTDAGPARSMLVRGRIADASVAIFEHVCAAPASVGLCDARWTVVP